MPGIAVELTNYCNLSCKHCFDKRHSAGGHLGIDTLETVLHNAKQHGFDYISLTGGEPTLHPEFQKILQMILNAGYEVGFVTNGWNFVDICKRMTEALVKVSVIKISLDGAKESTHDAMRRQGSFRRVMQAASICTVKDIPFAFNTAISSQNQNEIEALVELSTKLGSRGIRFGYLMPTQKSLDENLVLDYVQLKDIQATIIKMQEKHDFPIILAAGFYSHDLFPCTALQQMEFNIDWQGNVTLCCHLSGCGDGSSTKDTIGNLSEISFKEATRKIKQLVAQFHEYKIQHHDGAHFKDMDYFSCWYCLNYFEKINRLKDYPKTI
jgi:MoaA/NifB/PqqE/SkfB family radical SAM enzyme